MNRPFHACFCILLVFSNTTAAFGAKIATNLIPVYQLLLAGPQAKQFPDTVSLESRPTDTTVLRPDKGAAVADPVFGTRITRINKSDTAIANYPKVQSWNQDMSLLRIGSRLYYANTLTETDITKDKSIAAAYQTLCARSSDYFRWSNTRADRFFVINSAHQFIQGKINGNTVDCSNVLDSFSEYEEIHMGPHEGNIDYADRYVVFSAKQPGDSSLFIILYDIQNATRVWTKTITDNTWLWLNGRWQPSQLDWVSISPSGKYIVINERNKANYQQGLRRYDINYANPKTLRYDYQGTLYSEGGHGDIGYDQQGNEVVVQFMSGIGVHSFDLDHPDQPGKELLRSAYGGGHVSCRNTRRPGWCYITTHEAGYKQIFALKLDGTSQQTVQNFSQSHIHNQYPETYGAPNPDGTQIIFNSNWGNADGSVDSYLAEKSP